MKRSAPFTRKLAAILAVTFLQTSTAWAAAPVPGSLAVLEPSITLPEMKAAWDGIRDEIYLDPLLLTRGREEVLHELEQWRLAAQSLRSSHQTADRITLERAQSLIDQAWTYYYRFDIDHAVEVLSEAKKLLSSPGDSGFRTTLMFEVLLLGGITARAAGNDTYQDELMQAAAIDPTRELPPQKYSPETVSIYNRLKGDPGADQQVSVKVGGSPAGARVRLGGREPEITGPDPGYHVLPGTHFLDVSAPGYEPWGTTITARRYEPATVRFELVPAGPEGDPDSFFLERLKAGDARYLALLAEKLDVDYVLLPDPRSDVLKVWLIDRSGSTVDHAVLWEAGGTRQSASVRVSKLVEPLRQEFDRSRTTAGAPLTLPAFSQDLAKDPDDEGLSWKSYALAVGVLLLIGAAASADDSGGTRIEATW